MNLSLAELAPAWNKLADEWLDAVAKSKPKDGAAYLQKIGALRDCANELEAALAQQVHTDECRAMSHGRCVCAQQAHCECGIPTFSQDGRRCTNTGCGKAFAQRAQPLTEDQCQALRIVADHCAGYLNARNVVYAILDAQQEQPEMPTLKPLSEQQVRWVHRVAELVERGMCIADAMKKAAKEMGPLDPNDESA